jgi:hypothetical protein
LILLGIYGVISCTVSQRTANSAFARLCSRSTTDFPRFLHSSRQLPSVVQIGFDWLPRLSDCRGKTRYEGFHPAVVAFRKYYGLESLTFDQLDRYL